jgi:hypothetical protein
VAPVDSASPSNWCISTWLSTMPVDGEYSAAVHSSSGSIARAKSRDIQRRSSTPFSSERARIVSSTGCWPADVATISLPQRRYGTPRSSQYAYRRCFPSTHSRAFNEPCA